MRLLVAALVVTGCAYLLAGQSDDLSGAVGRLSPGRVVLSGAVAIVGTMCIERSWVALLRGFAVDVVNRDAAAVFYASQLGKYVPGSVWPVLVQVELGARWGAPRRVMLGASILLITLVTVTGISVGAMLLPWSSPDGIHQYWWLLVLLPPLVALLHPRVLTWFINLVSTWSGGQRLDAHVSGSGVRRGALWMLLAWVLFGTHLLVLMSAYGPVGPLALTTAVGGIALAWAAGLVFIPAPAGAGVREGVLLLTLGPVVGAEAALVTALASRVLLILADITLAATSVGWRALRGLSVERAERSARGTEGSASAPPAPVRRDQTG